RSMLTLYRRLLALRRREPALSVGRFIPMPTAPDDGLVRYIREDEAGRRLLIALNLTSSPQRMSLDDLSGRVILTTHLDREGERAEGAVELRADEGVVIELDAA